MATTYKCPNCGADIPYDAKSGQLKCQHCDTIFEIENLEAYNVEQNVNADVCDWNISNKETVSIDGKISYVCPACGGEVIADETNTAIACPYCGTAIVSNEKLSGILKPDMIIPFKLTKDDAKKAYSNFIRNKKLLPNDFKVNNIIDKLNGVYVPYWLFDGEASGQARFKATRSRSYRQGDYQITETSHYLVYRDGDASFEKIPVDASSKLDAALLDSIEPFDYADAKEFNSAYLSSYLADKYDEDQDETISKANSRIKNSLTMILARSVIGYDSVLPAGESIQISNGKAHYALLPVWLFQTKYHGKIYYFAMNGQTGKFTGDLPMDSSKAITYSLITFVIAFVLMFAITFFMRGV